MLISNLGGKSEFHFVRERVYDPKIDHSSSAEHATYIFNVHTSERRLSEEKNLGQP